MSWRDRYRVASFRGVEFFIKTVDSEFGRRQVVQQAALVDTPYSEDLGRAADQFVVEGYLVGDDYDLSRDELIKAIRDTAGPGRLVHPYQGEKSVVANGFRIREDSAEGRMCRFSVTFGEAGELEQPSETASSVNVLEDRAEAIQEEAKESFAERFGVAGFAQHVKEAATESISTLTDYLATPTGFLTDTYSEVTGIFNEVSGIASDVTSTVSEYQLQVTGFVGDLTDLINEPSSLASGITDLITGIRSSFTGSAGALLAGILSIFPRRDRSSDDDESQSASQAQIVANNDAIVDLVRQVVVSEIAPAVVSQTYPTVDDATNARDVVAEIIDQEAEATTSDPVYNQLTLARAEVVQALPAPDQTPARLLTYTPRATLPALAIAQTLYGDATRAEEIVTRNLPRHPGFVTGAVPLQVLSDG